MRAPVLLATAAAAALAAAPLAAQMPGTVSVQPTRPSRFTIGATGLLAAPRGAFQENVGSGIHGGGFNATGWFALDRLGILSLRADLGGVWYGRESQRYSILSPRVGVNVVTTNSIFTTAIGPELAVPRGALRPYVNGSVGWHHFSTSSALEGLDDTEQNYSTNNQSDGTSAWGAGGGVRIPIGPKRWGSTLDLGTKYYRGGEAEYLRKGDITDNSNGTVTLNTRRSHTDFQTFYLGFTANIRTSRGGPRHWWDG